MDWIWGIIVVASLALAVAMAGLAWRILRSDRQRADARVAMLRRMALEPTSPEPDHEPAAHWQDAELARSAPAIPVSPPEVFATLDRAPAPTRRWMGAMVVVVFMALGAATVYGLYPGSIAVGATGSPLSDFLSRRADPRPLELLSLSYRVESGDFIVTGLVQNPPTGRPSPEIVAVVYAFDAKGNYFASAKAPLEFGTLAPGAESPFVVRLPGTAQVSRFRVGFRTTDGAVISHEDHRGQAVDGTSGEPAPAEGI